MRDVLVNVYIEKSALTFADIQNIHFQLCKEKYLKSKGKIWWEKSQNLHLQIRLSLYWLHYSKDLFLSA